MIRFETFGEPGLEQMATAANDLMAELPGGIHGRWLTLSGNSGIGKTFLMRQIFEAAKRVPAIASHPALKVPNQFWTWSDVVDELRDKKFWLLKELAELNLLCLDDVGAENATSFSSERLYYLLNSRLGKWTVITTNKTVAQIAETDVRIASRLIRDKNQVVACEAVDYALRKGTVAV